MSAYREPGRAVDMTEIERAKIHAAAETKRKAIEEGEKTKRARVEARRALWTENGSALLFVIAVTIVGLIVGGVWVGDTWIETRNPPACVDRAASVAWGSLHCTHPEHSMTKRDGLDLCLCSRSAEKTR